MKFAGIQIRRRFFVSIGLGVAVTGAWFYWSRAMQRATVAGQTGDPVSFVKIVGAGQGAGGRVMEERAEYFDPTPLFLPTAMNFQQGALPARVVRQPGQVFGDFEPKMNFAETALPEYGAKTETGAESLSTLLAQGNDAPFAGFGQEDRADQPLARRGGFIEVKALKGGVLSLTETVAADEMPPTDFVPVEFLVAVASAGLIGDPVVQTSSGREDIDEKLKDYLVNVYRIGERLAPGRYAIWIGP